MIREIPLSWSLLFPIPTLSLSRVCGAVTMHETLWLHEFNWMYAGRILCLGLARCLRLRDSDNQYWNKYIAVALLLPG